MDYLRNFFKINFRNTVNNEDKRKYGTTTFQSHLGTIIKLKTRVRKKINLY